MHTCLGIGHKEAGGLQALIFFKKKNQVFTSPKEESTLQMPN